MVLLVADVIALSWVGMWTGLTARRANRAAGATVVRVLVLPCGVWAGLIFILSFTRFWHRLEDKWQVFLGLWFALGLILDLYFAVRARLRLIRDLRTVATQRFVPGRAFFFWWKPRPPRSNPALPPAIASET
jgi:hypothetical protein